MAQPVRIADKTYVFVDGAYFRKVADEFVEEMFSVPAEIDFPSLRGVSLNAERVFYYDCLNDVRKDGESDANFSKRVEAQQEFFDRIQGIEGFHVRLGSISGARKKLRQKKVDVLLAVEALDHAFRGNMSRACLIAGDLDFAPLVDSLIRLGTYLQVIYSRRSAAKELYIAADIGRPITFNQVYNWSTQDFKKRHPIPLATANEQLLPEVARAGVVRSGNANGSPISLYMVENDYVLYSPKFDLYSLKVRFPDRDFLEKYFGIVYGPITWNE
jgi:uncharacterized LabA/DUF88 family protein